MLATPLEQVVVLAVAMNCTFELTEAPFEGLMTSTVAQAGNAIARGSIRRVWIEIFTVAFITRDWNTVTKDLLPGMRMNRSGLACCRKLTRSFFHRVVLSTAHTAPAS